MTNIEQAIEALERCIAEPEAKPWHEINAALAALRSLPGPVTEEELQLAREFLADPDKRAQVKVQLEINGWSALADMIDEAVVVSRALLRISGK